MCKGAGSLHKCRLIPKTTSFLFLGWLCHRMQGCCACFAAAIRCSPAAGPANVSFRYRWRNKCKNFKPEANMPSRSQARLASSMLYLRYLTRAAAEILRTDNMRRSCHRITAEFLLGPRDPGDGAVQTRALLHRYFDLCSICLCLCCAVPCFQPLPETS